MNLGYSQKRTVISLLICDVYGDNHKECKHNKYKQLE